MSCKSVLSDQLIWFFRIISDPEIYYLFQCDLCMLLQICLGNLSWEQERMFIVGCELLRMGRISSLGNCALPHGSLGKWRGGQKVPVRPAVMLLSRKCSLLRSAYGHFSVDEFPLLG